MELCAKRTPKGCTAADFYFCSVSGIRSEFKLNFRYSDAYNSFASSCFPPIWTSLFFLPWLHLHIVAQIGSCYNANFRVLVGIVLLCAIILKFEFSFRIPLTTLLHDCIVFLLNEPSKRTWVVFLLFPRASSLTNLFLEHLPSRRWNWKFLLLWKISIKDKSSTVTSITNRRKNTKTHRLSSRLSTSTKKLERSSSRSRTRLRASTDVWKPLWRQSMVTTFPFEMTYRRWVALLIDLGTLLSPKLLICDPGTR